MLIILLLIKNNQIHQKNKKIIHQDKKIKIKIKIIDEDFCLFIYVFFL
jgi:hypothetical protein